MLSDLEWMRVVEDTGISFSYHVPNRQAWYSQWVAEFENILKEQVISDIIPLNTRPQHIYILHYKKLVQLWVNIAQK
jgi:hypothetical protein